MECCEISLVQMGCLADYDNCSEIELTILMPNGLMTTILASPEAKLLDIKEDVFLNAQEMPLFGALYDIHTYTFTCVNLTTAEQDEIDDNRRLIDVKPFLQILRLVERKGDMASKQLSAKIGMLIGKGLHEFDALKNPEVNEFRWKAKIHCQDIQKLRTMSSWEEKINYKYPIRVDNRKDNIAEYLKQLLTDDEIEIQFQFDNLELFCRLNQQLNDDLDQSTSECFDSQVTKIFQNSQTTKISYQLPADDVVLIAIKLFNCDQRNPEKLALKVCGQEEYLLGSHQLIKYKYIQECISSYKTPSLVVVSKENIPLENKIEYQNPDEFRNRSSTGHTHGSSTIRRKSTAEFSFSVKEKLMITINECLKVNLADETRLGIQLGLFHGGESLVHPVSTSDGIVMNGSCTWNECLSFEIAISDIPRMARLCFVIYEIIIRARKGSRGKFFRSNINCEITMNPLGWVNTLVFDYRGQLKTGSLTLSIWSFPEGYDREDMLNPLGTVMAHPNLDETTCLTISFKKYGSSLDTVILYPHLENILNMPNTLSANSTIGGSDCTSTTNIEFSDSISHLTGEHKFSAHYLNIIKGICSRDPLKCIPINDQELLWYFRDDCCIHLPHSLPYLLNCVKWNDHKVVIEMIKMLQQWPLIEPEKALELLDYAYTDCHVRCFAIKCLQNLSDDDLSLYLLQLVQALKCESYLFCDLAIFLLERALKNQTIGHHFFWLLKSEMCEPSISTYFGLILEAYCFGAYDHMKDLIKQTEVINKLKHMNEIVKREANTKGKDSKDRLASIMQEILNQSYYRDCLKEFVDPLNPRIRLKTIRSERCKLMDSKMKPLWLVFDNQDSRADDISIIFKNGDDLRQDMLTVQMLRIMDKIWKDNGLDLRMTPYGVIAIEKFVGLIEVVTNTQTLAKIQKSHSMRATSAFNKASLLNWLKSNNPEESLLNKAISQFALSCAGYCVATYVLGIADRHSDNILVASNGQILHIDFGHILGKFKEKFGIRRERVPFVLTNDFVYVITAGNTKKENFKLFQKYCEQAFAILRTKGSFIISLFAMMLSSGISELSSIDDLEYLRETLVLDLNKKDALKHFRCKFDDALKNSWKTNINWMAHNIAKDNN